MRPISTGAASRGRSGRTERGRPELLEHELDIARQVQQSLFPLPLPKPSGMRLAAVNQPARIVSGDLYDVIVIDPERVAILCADVSGKGFPAIGPLPGARSCGGLFPCRPNACPRREASITTPYVMRPY
jgi:hypothetical protein